jgi:hypothetical protein
VSETEERETETDRHSEDIRQTGDRDSRHTETQISLQTYDTDMEQTQTLFVAIDNLFHGREVAASNQFLHVYAETVHTSPTYYYTTILPYYYTTILPYYHTTILPYPCNLYTYNLLTGIYTSITYIPI